MASDLIGTLTFVLLIVSMIIGIYYIFLWKKFNEKMFALVKDTPAESQLMGVSANYYLGLEAFTILALCFAFNIIGAAIVVIMTPILQKISTDRMTKLLDGYERPKTKVVNFDE